MKKMIYIFAIASLFCLASCEKEVVPVLQPIVVEEVTADAVACSCEVMEGSIEQCGFYYATSKNNVTNKKGKKQSYHSYWDNALNYGRRKWTAEQYADAVDKATPKEYKAIVKGTAYRWADTSLPNFLRTFELTPKDSNVDAYSKKTRLEIRDICDEEAMKGGYRLAHVLNTIFTK